MTEKEITKSIRQLLKNLSVFHWKQLGTLGMPKGIADIIGIWEGRFLAIEVKRPGGKLSIEQELFLRRVNEKGGIGFVAYGIDDVIKALNIGHLFVDWGAKKIKVSRGASSN